MYYEYPIFIVKVKDDWYQLVFQYNEEQFTCWSALPSIDGIRRVVKRLYKESHGDLYGYMRNAVDGFHPLTKFVCKQSRENYKRIVDECHALYDHHIREAIQCYLDTQKRTSNINTKLTRKTSSKRPRKPSDGKSKVKPKKKLAPKQKSTQEKEQTPKRPRKRKLKCLTNDV